MGKKFNQGLVSIKAVSKQQDCRIINPSEHRTWCLLPNHMKTKHPVRITCSLFRFYAVYYSSVDLACKESMGIVILNRKLLSIWYYFYRYFKVCKDHYRIYSPISHIFLPKNVSMKEGERLISTTYLILHLTQILEYSQCAINI